MISGTLAWFQQYCEVVISGTGVPVAGAFAPNDKTSVEVCTWHQCGSLVCPSCGSEMKVIAFITEHDVVDAILRHLAKAETRSPRGPPGAATLPAVS